MSTFIRTGVFLTAEQLRHVKDEFSLPVMCGPGWGPPDPWKLISKYAVEQGLPETDEQYGADLKTGELLRMG